MHPENFNGLISIVAIAVCKSCLKSTKIYFRPLVTIYQSHKLNASVSVAAISIAPGTFLLWNRSRLHLILIYWNIYTDQGSNKYLLVSITHSRAKPLTSGSIQILCISTQEKRIAFVCFTNEYKCMHMHISERALEMVLVWTLTATHTQSHITQWRVYFEMGNRFFPAFSVSMSFHLSSPLRSWNRSAFEIADCSNMFRMFISFLLWENTCTWNLESQKVLVEAPNFVLRTSNVLRMFNNFALVLTANRM